MSRTRVVLVGLGATGLAIGASLSRRTDCDLVGAVDPRQDLAGQDLGLVLGVGPLGVLVAPTDEGFPDAEVAVVATSSRLESVATTVTPLLERGINVLSICEELASPRLSHPALARMLDEVARRNDVTLLGTGANPGMVMDTLPLLLSVLTTEVGRVVIRRTADMSRYGAILSKFGLGLTPAEFTAAREAGGVIGHVGFEQTIAALAGGLGWTLDEIAVDDVAPALLAETARRGAHRTLETGTIAAVKHAARGCVNGATVIDLEINFGFFKQADGFPNGDSCRIEGADQVIEVRSETGFESFLSTVSAAANVMTAVVAAKPGLRTMAELAVSDIASKGSRLSVAQEVR